MKSTLVDGTFCVGRAARLRGLNAWQRSRAALPMMAAAFWLAGFGAKAETTNRLSEAEIEGRQLAQQLYEQKPATNIVQTGVLIIRNSTKTKLPIRFQTQVETNLWGAIYDVTLGSNAVELIVLHRAGAPNCYALFEGVSPPRLGGFDEIRPFLPNSKLMTPFAGSDFWLCDLGLEFFHWPEQKIIKKEFRRNCSCMVLESTNPYPTPNGYSRVDSWIDEESGGIVMARAYDANGKLLKEFYPKDIKKVKGQWQVQTLDLYNVQTGSRTRLEFDLKAP